MIGIFNLTASNFGVAPNKALYYENDEDLHRVQTANLYLTGAGYNYQLWLYKNPSYLQEVLLDIDVEENELGQNWDYTSIEERIDLLMWFIKKLIRIDCQETNQFVQNFNMKVYMNIWMQNNLITKDILEGIYSSLSSILRSMRDRHLSPSTGQN